MAEIRPFRGIRYTVTECSNLLAPPYDVLSGEDKQALLARDEHNIVDIDLPHVPPKGAGPDRLYEQAAGKLTSWLDIHALSRDEEPALYVYHQTYLSDGKKLTRRQFFARLRLQPLGEGGIFAHEQTFGGPKEDRLKLTIACQCNLSPIFALYPDPKNEIAARLDKAVQRDPDQYGILDGVHNALWVVQDPAVIADVRKLIADKPIFIADGHHRYGTALMYRQRQIDELGLPLDDDPVNFVMTVFCGMEDPGVTILPYFRTLVAPRLTADKLREAVAEQLHWKTGACPTTLAGLAKLLGRGGPSAFALCFPEEDHCAVLSPKREDFLAERDPRQPPTWHRLAYAVFHHYLMDEVVQNKLSGGKAPTLHYHKSLEECIQDARVTSGVAALMPASTMAQLRDICMAGALMPQKSTYFAPKLATGLVLNPLYDD
jgi:uncharacterized protein (DUF1015 family)